MTALLRLSVAALAAAALAGCGGSERKVTAAEVRDDPGLRIFQAQDCGSCHTLGVAGSTSTMAPNLDNAVNNRTRDSIVQAIVNPPEDSIMPQDYGRRLNERQLGQLVDFLVRATGD